MWHFIASRLGKSVRQAKRSISATEFIRWQKFFQDEIERPGKQDFYFAKIAYEIHTFRTAFLKWLGNKDAEFKELRDFILEFDGDEPTALEDAPEKIKVPKLSRQTTPGKVTPLKLPKPLSKEEIAKLPQHVQTHILRSKSMWYGLLESRRVQGHKEKVAEAKAEGKPLTTARPPKKINPVKKPKKDDKK